MNRKYSIVTENNIKGHPKSRVMLSHQELYFERGEERLRPVVDFMSGIFPSTRRAKRYLKMLAV